MFHQLNFNPVNFFILSGILQSFIVIVLLANTRASNRLSNWLLAGMLLVINLHVLYLMILDTNLDNQFPPLLWMPYSFMTAAGPLLYFYTRSLSDHQFRVSAVQMRHFIPVAIEFLLQVIQIIYSIRLKEMYYNTPLYFWLTPLIAIATTISVFHYGRLALSVIQQHESWSLKYFSNLKSVTLNWLSVLINCFRAIWYIWLPFITLFLLFFRYHWLNFAVIAILYALLACITYLNLWIGLQGWRHGNTIIIKKEPAYQENKNYGQLDKKTLAALAEKCISLMKLEKLFTDDQLNLKTFSDRIPADANLISYVLNAHIGKSFYEFVNHYRIEEVKQKLHDPNFRDHSILGIAYECGFNSKTAFNRVFKQETGITPSAFQKKGTIPHSGTSSDTHDTILP